MQRIGFIGASGLMGHGMAKNLRAKGYPLALTVHRNRDRVADLLAAGATLAATRAELARSSDIVFICVTGSPQIEAAVSRAGRPVVRCGARNDHRRHLHRRARLDHAAARTLRGEGRAIRRRTAGAHASRRRGRQVERDGRRHRRAVRPTRIRDCTPSPRTCSMSANPVPAT